MPALTDDILATLPNPLGVTSHAFARAARELRTPERDALLAYKAFHRAPTDAMPWSVPEPTKIHASEGPEGTTRKFLLPVKGREPRRSARSLPLAGEGGTLETESVVIPMRTRGGS
ncbi:MAG: hypothetical protein AAGH64_11475, partial [Planctomycetota bacterium]